MDKKTKNDKSKLKIIENILKELLEQLGVSATFTIEEKEEGVNINLQTDNPGALIGYHGETLSAIQLMLGMMIYRKLGEWTRILVNVGDYRERRKEVLERMAFAVAQKVKFSGQPQPLPPMSSFERRIIHLVLVNDQGVETISDGEGKSRHVVIKPQ